MIIEMISGSISRRVVWPSVIRTCIPWICSQISYRLCYGVRLPVCPNTLGKDGMFTVGPDQFETLLLPVTVVNRCTSSKEA